jgi:hypothetical protein
MPAFTSLTLLRRVDESLTRVEGWFSKSICDSVVSLSDRLLARASFPNGAHAEQDLRDLLAQHDLLTEVAAHQADAGELHLDAPALLVPLWAWPRQGEPADALRRILEPAVRSMLAQQDALPEPARSAFTYWAHLTGFAATFEPGPHPEQELASLYHDTHLVFYATEYGKRSAPRSSLPGVTERLEDVMRRDGVTADLLAEALVALLALTPARPEVTQRLVERLLEKQRVDGDFGAPEDDFDQRHHATCAAWLGLSRWRAEREGVVMKGATIGHV